MNMEALHGASDNTQGWLRLGLSLVTWVTALAIGFGSIKANIEAQTTATHDLTTRVDRLSDSVNQLAIVTEGVRHDLADVKTRVDHLETADRRTR